VTAIPAFDPFAPDIRANPYPLYHRMRTEDPVHWSEAQEAYLCTRYSDCVDVLRDPRSSSDGENASTTTARRAAMAEQAGDGMGSMFAVLDVQPMLFSDPPDHTRIRSLVNKAFTPRRVEALRPHIQQIVDRLLDKAEPAGRLDVQADLSFPLPVIVIAEMLGVPLDEQDQLKEWSGDLARTIDPVVSVETAQRAAMSGLAFINYLNGLIDERRRDPRDDLLSALITAEESGEHLSHQELLVNCILLFIAGHETTQNLIGNGTLALLRHQGELERLRADPSLTKNAIEEALRYDGPVQLTARHFVDDIDIGGTTVAKGKTAILLLAAADRDPSQFPDPDRFDIGRDGANRHIAFGNGIHFCLGAPLARVEAQIAIGTLVRRYPNLALADADPPYGDGFTLRGVATLPVAL
jgi:cytochrome P450